MCLLTWVMVVLSSTSWFIINLFFFCGRKSTTKCTQSEGRGWTSRYHTSTTLAYYTYRLLNCNSFKFKFQFCCTLRFIPTRFYSTCTNTRLYTTTLHGYSLIRILCRWITNRNKTEKHTYLSLLLNVLCSPGQVRGNASPK
jgi:hypothetical protein